MFTRITVFRGCVLVQWRAHSGTQLILPASVHVPRHACDVIRVKQRNQLATACSLGPRYSVFLFNAAHQFPPPRRTRHTVISTCRPEIVIRALMPAGCHLVGCETMHSPDAGSSRCDVRGGSRKEPRTLVSLCIRVLKASPVEAGTHAVQGKTSATCILFPERLLSIPPSANLLPTRASLSSCGAALSMVTSPRWGPTMRPHWVSRWTVQPESERKLPYRRLSEFNVRTSSMYQPYQ